MHMVLQSFAVDGTSTSTAADASCPVPASILTYVDKKGRSCQPVVILASLLDKPANLGGLARTCEVFRAEALVLGSLAVVGESLFRSLAVTAYEWACMEERHASELLACIREKKALG